LQYLRTRYRGNLMGMRLQRHTVYLVYWRRFLLSYRQVPLGKRKGYSFVLATRVMAYRRIEVFVCSHQCFSDLFFNLADK